MSDERKVVGHKTFSDGPLSFRHEPLYEDEAKAIMEASDKHLADRAARLPDEATAIRAMFDAYDRLRELGWREACYCPKDGSSFFVLEAGSTGIFRCNYDGEWPKGTWWTEDGGDLWPSRPILFKLFPEDQAKYDANMERAKARYRHQSDKAVCAGGAELIYAKCPKCGATSHDECPDGE